MADQLYTGHDDKMELDAQGDSWKIEDERDVVIATDPGDDGMTLTYTMGYQERADGTTTTVIGIPPHRSNHEVIQAVKRACIYHDTRSGEACRVSWLSLLLSPAGAILRTPIKDVFAE